MGNAVAGRIPSASPLFASPFALILFAEQKAKSFLEFLHTRSKRISRFVCKTAQTRKKIMIHFHVGRAPSRMRSKFFASSAHGALPFPARLQSLSDLATLPLRDSRGHFYTRGSPWGLSLINPPFSFFLARLPDYRSLFYALPARAFLFPPSTSVPKARSRFASMLTGVQTSTAWLIRFGQW